jgi:transcription antitermination factor NusG
MSRWYIIHAYSGFEGKVRDQIMADATRMGLDRFVESVEVPTETVTEVRRGKKIQSERKFFPGYVLAKLDMNDDVYHLVKNTPKVTGFLGIDGQAPGDHRGRGRTHPQHQGGSRRRAEAQGQRRLRHRRHGQGHLGQFRDLLWRRRGARFRQEPGQGLDLDLRPR